MDPRPDSVLAPRDTNQTQTPSASRGLAGGAFLFLAAYFVLLQLPSQFPALQIPGTHWNWSGKLLTIAFSVLLLVFSPWLRENVGLRFRQAPGSLKFSVACTVIGTGVFVFLRSRLSPVPFSGEALLFQAVMPGIDEELAVRGIALALFERAFGASPMSSRFRFGWAAFVTSFLFGLGHGVSFGVAGIGFHGFPFILTTGFGCVAALMRTRSGSLLWPILLHSSVNFAGELTAMLKFQWP